MNGNTARVLGIVCEAEIRDGEKGAADGGVCSYLCAWWGHTLAVTVEVWV